MQTTILTCDWCVGGKQGVVFAVTTLTLGNGKPPARAPHLDLCARHARKLERLFEPRKKIGRPVGSKNGVRANAGGPGKPGKRATRHEALWKAAEVKFLAALKGKEEGVMGPAVAKAARLSKHITYKVAKRLLGAGKIKRAAEDGRQGYLLA